MAKVKKRDGKCESVLYIYLWMQMQSPDMVFITQNVCIHRFSHFISGLVISFDWLFINLWIEFSWAFWFACMHAIVNRLLLGSTFAMATTQMKTYIIVRTNHLIYIFVEKYFSSSFFHLYFIETHQFLFFCLLYRCFKFCSWFFIVFVCCRHCCCQMYNCTWTKCQHAPDETPWFISPARIHLPLANALACDIIHCSFRLAKPDNVDGYFAT